MRLPYPHRRLSITFAARALSLSAPDRSRSADGREAWAIGAKWKSRRRGAPLGPSYGLMTCFLVARPPPRIHGSLKGSAEPFGEWSGGRS